MTRSRQRSERLPAHVSIPVRRIVFGASDTLKDEVQEFRNVQTVVHEV